MQQNNISLDTAQEWAKNFRKNSSSTIIGQLVPRANLEQLLACSEGQDVRIYYGIDERGEQKLMLVSVDAAGNDLINESKNQFIYDRSLPCPPYDDDVNSPLFKL